MPKLRQSLPARRLSAGRLLGLLAALVVGTAGCGDRGPADGSSPFAIRGTIEGFYGRPYSTAERVRLLHFTGARGMNAYVYAPKLDPKHRDLWREPYSDLELADFAELARVGAEAGVRVYFAISPGITYRGEDARDWELLEAKLRAVSATGVTGFALLFDDIFDPASEALDPAFQAALAARVADLVTGFGPDVDFWFIGNLYAGTAEQYADDTIDRRLFFHEAPPTAYFAAYDERVPAGIPLMWTGPGVLSPALRRDVARAFHELAGRPVVVWDNYPVNDVFTGELFLGPYQGRDPDLGDAVEGVVVNLMTQPTAGLIPVATAADYLRDPRGYRPEESWRRALDAVGGDAGGAAALRLFAEQHRGHPFLEGATEAPELGRRIAAAFAAPASGDDRAALQTLLESLAGIRSRLGATVRDEGLLAEIDPWATKLEALARAAILGLDAASGAVSPADYRSARDAALSGPLFVARDDASSFFEDLAGAPVRRTDRFADLFAAIDARLSASTPAGGSRRGP